MPLELKILIAVVLDLLFGDPRWLPHPVKLIGRFAGALEAPARRLVTSARWAGVVTCGTVTGATALITALLCIGLHRIHPIAGDITDIIIIYTGIAAGDLYAHGMTVRTALAEGDLQGARAAVSMICGRDTESLDEAGASRATVESIAENMVDGVTAPLFYAVLGGPIGIMAYKAVSTLDSTFGYKNERYIDFGWASARLDDVAAFMPCRLTALLVPLAALILRERPLTSIRVLARDRNRHPSPNAGQAEAAVAGALGVQLGGLSFYDGKPEEKPTLGDPIETPTADHIRRAGILMLVTSALALMVLLGARAAVLGIGTRSLF
jgi:adenosylcobinamide-phosphate synthase